MPSVTYRRHAWEMIASWAGGGRRRRKREISALLLPTIYSFVVLLSLYRISLIERSQPFADAHHDAKNDCHIAEQLRPENPRWDFPRVQPNSNPARQRGIVAALVLFHKGERPPEWQAAQFRLACYPYWEGNGHEHEPSAHEEQNPVVDESHGSLVFHRVATPLCGKKYPFPITGRDSSQSYYLPTYTPTPGILVRFDHLQMEE